MSALALVSFFVILVLVGKKSTINIYAVPEDSNISVDDKDIGKGHVTLRVTNGTHQIRATRDGYNTYSEKMSINKDTSQTIILTQNTQQQAITVNTPPFAAGSFQPITTDTLIAIDSNNSNLIKIGKNGITTLYAKPVYAFSFANPYVALIEMGNRDKIAIVNIENGNIKNFDAKSFAPVISISINSDIKNFYFLGKLDPITRNSTLYINSLEDFNPQTKGVYAADNVKALADNKILLTLNADAADLSGFSIYSVVDKKYLYNTSGSGATISPSHKTVAFFSSNSLSSVSVDSLDKKDYGFSFTNQKIAWFDVNTLIILTNTFPGVQFNKIDTLSNSQTSKINIAKLSQISVRFVFGVIENNLFLQDSDGKIWSVNIP